MEEIKNIITEITIGDNSLAITKGYGYTNKEGKQRYTYNDVYYTENGETKRKYSNEKGDFYYNIELVDVVIEKYLLKDGSKGSKTYLLSEVPYLAESAEKADENVLRNYLSFKLHR